MVEEEGREKEEDNLNVVRRHLYAREEPEDLQQRGAELRSLGVTRRPTVARPESGKILAALNFKNLALLRAKRWGRVFRFSGLLTLGLVVVVTAVALTVWYRSTRTVTENQVVLSIEAPGEFTAGEEIIYRVSYGNDSRVDWENVELVLSMPRGFTFKGSNREVEQLGKQLVVKLDKLASGETGELDVRGQLIGEQNETATARVELVLTPENFPGGRFTKTAALATAITALPLDVSLNIPGDAASGERVLASMTVRNLSNHVLEGAYLRLKLAPGVQLADQDSDFSPGFSTVDSGWQLPTLASLVEEELVMIFYVEGQPGEKRVIDIEAGIRQGEEDFTQRALTHVVMVSASEVVVDQVYNGSAGPLTVRAGEQVTGEVRYRNVGTVGLRDVIIEVRFEGSSFDPGTIVLGAGSYDPTRHTIVWSAATVPELGVLQPQQEGILSYSFAILPTDRFPKTGEATKNHVLVTTATVDSPDLPAPVGQPRKVISDRAVLSVRTDFILEAAAIYDDGRLGLTSSGPLPPRVGETTTYTLRWRIGSTLNDVADVRLIAVLPDGVTYTGQLYKTGGGFVLNERTGEVAWTLPFLEGLTGRALPYQELHVQVAITPGEDKRGNSVSLLNKVDLSGADQFTEEAVEMGLSEFPNTATAVDGKGEVQ